MRFSRQEYCSGLLHPPPRDLPDPGIEPTSLLSPVLEGWFVTTSATWEALTGICAVLCLVAQSCPTLCDPMDCRNSPCQNTGVGSLYLLWGIFSTQGLNPGLLHCRQILYQLSHEGSPGILEWVAYPFFSRSSQPRNQTRVSYVAGGFFIN